MNLREEREQWEADYLSKFASKSRYTRGRKKQEAACEVRTEYQRDRDRITHAKAFRRLMHKTQVFISPEGDHYRTRLTHTLEVAQISRTIARALLLNEDLTEAIALGHDLGHTPFGHTGEEALDQIVAGGFEHNRQSIRVVEQLERDGEGLNLTYEVLDGIVNHRSTGTPNTLEGAVVRLSDKIAYINHDIDDAIRAGLLKPEKLPKDAIAILGETVSRRIDSLIKSVIQCSKDQGSICLEPDVDGAMKQLRKFMFENVYNSQLQLKEKNKIIHMIQELFEHFYQNPTEIPGWNERKENLEIAVCDYIAGMTDRFAIKVFNQLFVPVSFSNM